MSTGAESSGQSQSVTGENAIGQTLDQLLSNVQSDPQVDQIVSDVLSSLPSFEHGAETVLTASAEKIFHQLVTSLKDTEGAKLAGQPIVRDAAQLISYLQSLLKGGQSFGASLLIEAGKRAADNLAARQAVSLPLGHKEHMLHKVILAPINAIRKRKQAAAAPTSSTSDTETAAVVKKEKKKSIKRAAAEAEAGTVEIKKE